MRNLAVTLPAPLACALASLLAVIAPATVAQRARPAVPGLWVNEHQQLSCGTQRVYDADINLADPAAVQARLIWKLGDLGAYADLALVGRVNSQHQERLADPPYGTITVSSVVKALRPDGRAAVAVVYTLQKDNVSPAACGFVDAVIVVGRPVQLTGSDGLPVTLTLLLPSPAAPAPGPADDNG